MFASRPIVCLVTDRARLTPPSVESLVSLVRHAADAGVDLVQVRERDLDARPLAALVGRLVEDLRRTGTRIVVNDRLDVALASGAHGVHLRGDSCGVGRVRRLCPEGFLVGRAVHSVAEAREAAAAGADYLVVGTIYPTASKPASGGGAGPGLVRAISAAVDVPLLAIGGLSADNVGNVAAAGASGVAAIGFFSDAFATHDPAGASAVLAARVAELRSRFVSGASRA